MLQGAAKKQLLAIFSASIQILLSAQTLLVGQTNQWTNKQNTDENTSEWVSSFFKTHRQIRGHSKVKVKEADLYSAFIEVPYTQGAQVRITQCYLQTTPYLPFTCYKQLKVK